MVIVAYGHPHVGLGTSIRVRPQPAETPNLFESPIAAIVVEIIRTEIISHYQVRPPVLIEVRPSHCKPVPACSILDAGLSRHIFEFAAALIAEKKIRCRFQA